MLWDNRIENTQQQWVFEKGTIEFLQKEGFFFLLGRAVYGGIQRPACESLGLKPWSQNWFATRSTPKLLITGLFGSATIPGSGGIQSCV